MRRRDFIKGIVGSAANWPLAVRAQQPGMPVIGFVNGASPGAYPPLSIFLKGLGEAGLAEGHDVTIEYRWAHGQYERLPVLIADLVQRKVSVIAATSTAAAVAAKAASTTIPIVFTTSGDPVQLGLVSSLNKPDGNLTGVTQLNVESTPKRLELMHEVLPSATNIALLVNPASPLADPVSQKISATAATLGLKLQVLRLSSEQNLAAVFESMAPLRAEALVIGSDALFTNRAEQLGSLALRYRVPAIYQNLEFAEAGGLMSYSGNVAEGYHLAGVYVGRIIKGEKPADLPVQEVTKVELIINLKTAKVLGITVPISLLGRADKVIE
jgi:putative ABC transport system substrate-binding protein